MIRRLQSIPNPSGPLDGDGRARGDVLQGALPLTEDIERVASVFRLLGDPGRVRILATLLEVGEVCVHDLASVSGQSESSVSQALRLMRAQRVVKTRRAGRVVFYRLDDSHVRMLLDMAITHVGHSPAISSSPSGVESSTEPTHQESL
ncbi:MAG: ArsR/SmtB family transcription factor [Actinomycetales bacterium]|mgnify:CR=1 FL=1|uniref:ArsR/SmtB family transcription factor n=1 Tax=uncultured Salinibacterium sp. TaxID=459274 RepID=UPI0030DC1E9C|tara:strand:+ start:5274 stop:5717 length:444 start_codon:yes stop_codon:yes gene_type:complete